MSKQFLKLEQTSNYIIFQVYSKEGTKIEKSCRFYCDIETIENLKYNKVVIEKDIAYFLELELFPNNKLRLKFYFLNHYGVNSISGKFFELNVKFIDVVNFIVEKKEKQFLNDIIEQNNCELILSGSIRSILENKVYKKKIRKQLIKLKDVYSYKKCYIKLDFLSKSDLYFKYENGYNGGIIFNKDYKNPNNLKLGKYSMHT